jgi:hypothetical protein
MIQPAYAHVVGAQTTARMPTRFAALEALLAAVTSAGVVIGRESIPTDSGLEAISIFSDTADDCFLIMRINDHTFTITRRPQ